MKRRTNQPLSSAQFLLIFGMTCSTRYKDVRSKVTDKTGILVGLCCQFFLMPFIGFLIIKVRGRAEVLAQRAATPPVFPG